MKASRATDAAPRILLIGTADTKSPEMLFLRERIEAQGGQAVLMDVGVLGRAAFEPDIGAEQVALAAGTTLAEVAATGDENDAMILMARGAARLAARLQAEGRIDGLLAMGGTMGTDLALDVAAALPVGVPKVLLSTIAYSHLLPPERITPDLIMVLWAGGLYGLNSLCRSSLAQAAGAVVGACRGAAAPHFERPMIAITSLGTSGLRYVIPLKPALEARGYEVAVFHTTGMGGRAFEALAAQGLFSAVFDFSLQELANHLGNSCVTAGPDRLRGAGRAGTPQLVAPGAVDMIDHASWQPAPMEHARNGLHHVHNRLIASVCTDGPFRREVACAIAERLGEASGPYCVLLPLRGVEEWDRPEGPLHHPRAHAEFVSALRAQPLPAGHLVEVDAHINDEAFTEAALAVFDRWVREGLVAPGLATQEMAAS